MLSPPLLPGRILVHRVHAFVPNGFFPNRATWRTGGWPARLRRRYPRSLTKALIHLRTEGVAQTWTKIRTRVALERLDGWDGAFAAVGTVVEAPDTGIPAGTPVLCWSWQGPLDAEFHLVAPAHCLVVPDLLPEFAFAPFLGWIANVIRSIDGTSNSFELCGLDPAMSAPLVRLLSSRPSSGTHAKIGYGPQLDRGPRRNTISIRLRADRAVGTLVAAGPGGVDCRLPDPAHYFLDPYYPGDVEFPWPFTRATVEEAVRILAGATRERSFTTLAGCDRPQRVLRLGSSRNRPGSSHQGVSCLGAGNYVRAVLLHHLRRYKTFNVQGVMDIRPEIAAAQGRALGARFCTTAPEAILDDEDTELVLIASDHASHADYAVSALGAGKAVHLEKPPAVTPSQLARLLQCLRNTTAPRLHLGYNRRDAPAVIELQSHLDAITGPTSVACRVRGYRLSRAHWYRWPNQGTRVAGNLVHWIDLGYRFTGGQRPTAVEVRVAHGTPDDEGVELVICFEDKSVVTIDFDVSGDPTYGVHEVIEVKKQELIAHIDDFRALRIESRKRFIQRTYSRDKGHAANMAALAALDIDERRHAEMIRDLELTGAIQFAAERALLEGGGRIELTSPGLAWHDAIA
jgi:predicted dehydrogenase